MSILAVLASLLGHVQGMERSEDFTAVRRPLNNVRQPLRALEIISWPYRDWHPT